MVFWLLITVLVAWVVFRYRRRRMYVLASRIPGSEGELPFIGLLHKFTGSTEDIMSSLKELCYTAMEHNGMVRLWLGHILYIISVDPVDNEMVLKTCMEKDDLNRFFREVIGYGGIFAPVNIWRPRRKILVPAFTPKIVHGFLPTIAEESMKLAKKLTKHGGERKFSTWSYLSSYTFDSICGTACGIKMNAQDNAESPFLSELNNMMRLACERVFHLWLQPNWLYKLFPRCQQFESGRKFLHGFIDDVVSKKREELKHKISDRPEADHELDLSSYASNTFLDLLIHHSGGEKGYNNLELREEILTLTIAATDTSAAAIGYTLKMLAKHPEIQEKVYQELDEVFGDSDRLLEKEDLMRLKYLERVIKETLRLFPPVPFIIRKVEEEFTLRRVMPVGAGAVMSIWGAHRNPEYWGPDAEEFDPDRFLPERFKLKHPCAYMPFSSGPRNCIGYQYAMMSIKTALSSVLRYNRVVTEPGSQIRVKVDIIMKDAEGYQIAFERRKPKC